MILGIFLTSSCSPARYCAKHFPPKTDTITNVDTVWTERIVTIEYPADTVEIFIPRTQIDRSQGKPIVKFKKSKQSSVKVTLDSAGLKAEAICSEKDSIIKLLQAEITNTTKISEVTHIPTNDPPWYLKWAGYWALITIPLFILKIINILKKLI